MNASAAPMRLYTERASEYVRFVSRDNALMRPLIGRWWGANLYTTAALASVFRRAGFARVDFGKFPASALRLNLCGHVVEART